MRKYLDRGYSIKIETIPKELESSEQILFRKLFKYYWKNNTNDIHFCGSKWVHYHIYDKIASESKNSIGALWKFYDDIILKDIIKNTPHKKNKIRS